MARPGDLAARIGRWLVTPPTSATLWRRAAISLWLLPPVMMFPLLLPILEPSAMPGVLMEFWQPYLLVFGIPFALAALCWRRANRSRSR
ncbi:hypothetical protein [Sphingomonas colocasiae]|uniref:DUF3311 domain-containing protein n=1 Tax=Sphingomonas colocasiae TaxID=1848973 RepID=A0ABS7PYB4_9SPHN|nr:hypothetical protein [Sphingomonas colocasiae]MBY8824969.1 hypothetical protein [Sphingomonas colocasiae]